MRWREVSISKPAGTTRIAFVGDSFTFGQWADSVEQSFVGVVASRLAPRGFDVQNFGVPGYGLADIQLLIEEEVLRFNPDTIVLMFYNGNDFLDTYLGLERYSVARSGVLMTNADLVERKIPEGFRVGARSLRRSLDDHVYLARAVNAALNRVAPSRAVIGARPQDRSYESNVFWSQARYPEFAATARDLSMDVLSRIVAVCRSRGVELRIAAIPSMEQVRRPHEFGGEYRRDLPQRYLEEFATAHGAPFVDLLPGLADYASRTGEEVYYPQDGHFNNAGHDAAGEVLTRFIAGGPAVSRR